MRILIIGLNYSPEKVGCGRYTSEMAHWLAEQGDTVTVITATPYYPYWRIYPNHANAFQTSTENGVRVKRCPLYVPRKPTAISRIAHLFSFFITSAAPTIRSALEGTDVVISIAPTILYSPTALLAARLAKSKSVLHFQDFELDAMSGAGVSRTNWATRVGQIVQSSLLKRFDLVTTISDAMLKKVLSHGLAKTKVALVPNWASPNISPHGKKDTALLAHLGVCPSKKTVLYCGSMGYKQGLDLILKANNASCLQEIQFLFCGSGAYRDDFSRLIATGRHRNVFLRDPVSEDLLGALLRSADAHLVLQKQGVSDAVLPSKLTNILAAGGNAVITAEANSTLGRLCSDHPGIAVRAEPDHPDALADGILEALRWQKPNPVAYNYASLFLSQQNILRNFRNLLAHMASVPDPGLPV